MKKSRLIARLSLLVATAAGCAMYPSTSVADPSPDPAAVHVKMLGPEETAVCKKLGLDPAVIAALDAKPLYKFTEKEVDMYLGYLQAVEPDLPKRVVRIGRKNIGQPYEIYLLGEAPYELYDPQPLYCLQKSDCVVFCEHTYAMALSHDWPSFFATLQRIRYKDGRISVLSRNHYTVADWDRNNSWLVRDVTDEVAAGRTQPFDQTLDRNKFFKKRYKLNTEFPVQDVKTTYVPIDAMEEAVKHLHNGDFVNVIYGPKNPYAGHTGLIAIAPDGTVDFLHSTPPKVREEPILAYLKRNAAKNAQREKKGNPVFVGFKFLRLEPDPLANLRAIDGPDAPHVTLGSGVKFSR